MLIRRELPADRSAVYDVHTSAFAERSTPGTVPVEAPLVDALRAEGDVVPALCLVAVEDGMVVGHVCCSRSQLDGVDHGLVGLGPLGVWRDRQKGGVGKALMHAVLGAADAMDVPAVVLLGDPGYYSRFGFVLASEHGITPPDPEWDKYFQIRTLSAFRPDLAGAFQYAPAIERL